MLFGRSGRTLKRLDNMLDDALNNKFEEQNYDESKLSRLEVKWKRYLTASKNSGIKVKQERDNIKMLLSDISHQTKTPLANILLYTQLVKEKIEDEELIKMIEKVEEQSEKLEFLMQSLIKTSRLETDVFTLVPKKQKLKPVLESVISQVAYQAAEKGIRIELELGEEESCFDRKWTEEAIYNIVDNAIKYSPKDSHIRITVNRYDIFTAVCVEDEGIGIREEEFAQIFGRFYRGKDVSDEKGLGIGLYLTREIAAKQGGYIDVKSVYGQGSQFLFYMPN